MPSTSETEGEDKISRLLKVRAKINARRPWFRRGESWRYKRMHPQWRKPKGLDNKIRVGRKSRIAMVNIGYRGPKKTRDLHPTGLVEYLVYNQNELDVLNSKNHILRIAGSVGRRKRQTIIESAKVKGFKIANPGRPAAEKEE